MSRAIKFRVYEKPHSGLPGRMLSDFGYGTAEQAYGVNENIKRYQEHENWEVMQFTSLFDKAGKEIYEDDILQWIDYWKCSCGATHNNQTKVGYVQMWYGSFIVDKKEMSQYNNYEPKHLNQFAVSRDEEYHNFYGYDGYLCKDIEVIGNIHQNPELIKK